MVTQTYKYRSVSRDHPDTHLLTLYPAELYSDEIRIQLTKTRLSLPNSDIAEYEALSYAWGDPTMTYAATVVDSVGEDEDDNWPGGVLPITSNMNTALRCLRHRQKPRVLWIDALCINQSDLKERSHQVQWMDLVYRKARRVIVFLGAESDDDAQAVDMLTSVGASLSIEGPSLNPWMTINSPFHPPHHYHQPETPDRHASKAVDRLRTLKGSVRAVTALLRLSHDKTFIKLSEHRTPSEYLEHDGKRASALNMDMAAVVAAMKLISRPWFSRLWVIQEVRTMADPEASILQYGRRAVPWEHFRKGVFAFHHLGKVDMECQEAVLAIQTRLVNMVRMLCHREVKMSTRDFLGLQHFGCADPRDRIYGVLSLLRDDLGYPLAVDYHASAEDVFENFQRQELRVRGLWQLPLCHLDPESGWAAPSWVPNQLSVPSHLQEIKEVPTIRFTTDFGFLGDRCLGVHGCHVATVQTVVKTPSLVEHWSPVDGPVSLIIWCQKVAYNLCGEAWPPSPTSQDEDIQDKEKRQKRLAGMILGLCDIRGDYMETHIPDLPANLYLRREHMKALILVIFSLPSLTPEALLDPNQAQAVVAMLPPGLVDFLLALYVNLCRAFGFSSRPIALATDDGEVGYGPALARPGDEVFTVIGCRANLLLRPVQNTENSDTTIEDGKQKHIIVGPVSLASNIRSEKVLGPLPAHVFLALDREQTLHTFRDARTGAKVHDPRFAKLGLGEAVEKLTDTYIRAGDFKMSPEELRQHGINVKPIYLI